LEDFMRNLAVSTLLLAGILAFVPCPAGAASIVHAGDPTFSFLGPDVFTPGQSHLGVDFERYAKDQASSDPTVRAEESELRFAVSAARTFGRYVTLVAKVPFARRTITTGTDSAWLFGLSDPEVRAHYQFFTDGAGSWASATLGFRPHLGQNDRTIDGTLGEEQLQPGVGASALEGGVSFLHALSENADVYGSALARKNGRNERGYEYGNSILLNLGAEKPLGEKVVGGLEANFRYASSDEVTEGKVEDNTGGTVVYLSPRVRVTLNERLLLHVSAQVPVVKSLTGDQNEKVNFLSGLTVKF
jgi:hypothetical protein